MALVSSTIPCTKIMIEQKDDVEFVCIDLLQGDSPTRCVCVYFSPSGSTGELFERMTLLCSKLDEICDSDTRLCLTGDFNLPQIDWETWSCPGKSVSTKESVFLDLCIKYGFSQHVAGPTRPKSNDVLDLVLCIDDCIGDVRIEGAPFKSDHAAVLFDLLLPQAVELNTATKATDIDQSAIFDYAAGDSEMIRLNLSLTEWNRYRRDSRVV